MLDEDVIEAFRQRAEVAGSGYQAARSTAFNCVLREYLAGGSLTLEALCRMIREELRSA